MIFGKNRVPLPLLYCATVGAIESANTVGYTSATSGADNNFITVPFNAVGYNTADIQQIGISDGGAMSIGWGQETFAIWAGLPSVVDGTSYQYLDPVNDITGQATGYYWGNDSYEPVAFSVAPGQGIVVNCVADLSFVTSGDVPATNKIEFTSVADNNFTGNPFPAPIDIQAIKISDGGAMSIGWGQETFAIWEGLPTVVDGTSYQYLDPVNDISGEATDYYWGNDSFEKVTFSIPAGQGVVINCPADLTISIESPYTL